MRRPFPSGQRSAASAGTGGPRGMKFHRGESGLTHTPLAEADAFLRPKNAVSGKCYLL